MSKILLEVKNVSKSFSTKKRHLTIRDRMLKFSRSRVEKSTTVLENINFSVRQNEFLGIVGSNGSGKSTLLRLIIGYYKPDPGGEIMCHSKMIRLALGLGFDANLSGRDNIYVNGSILGLSFQEIGNQFNSIVKFADIEEHIDTPLKFYSSGMKSRLSFAISMFVNTDILLIDEFFGGVGDISFRRKSDDVFRNRILNDKTVIFVSHNLELIKKYSDRVVLLDKGKQVMVGEPALVLNRYKKEYQ